jgi:hypothetical protein
VKLAALVGVPGGALLALPTAWNFIKQVLAEIDRRKQLTLPTQEALRG